MANSIVKIICGFLLVLCHAQLGLAVDYYVGDKAGWNLETDYGAWATGKNFKVGDFLVFLYDRDSGHNVIKVDEEAFYKCDPSHPLSFSDSSPTWMPLGRPGSHYFISGGQDDCRIGMALAVNAV